MSGDVQQLNSKIERAVADGQLMESAAKNIHALLKGAPTDLYSRSVEELVSADEWSELNDRFYRTLSFGTGGLRGRTIGKIVTAAERGKARESERPEFPCVGTNAMNFFNISRATQGLVAYVRECNARRRGIGFQPIDRQDADSTIVIAHDPRFFSKEFAELAAKVASENSCDAFVFDRPRSVPELSFAVRYLKTSAGVVITASHNPPYDNGYKVYFSDGAQVIEPHASGIIAKVNVIASEGYEPLPKDRHGKVAIIGKDIDEAYMQRLETLVLDPTVIREAKSLRIIYTPLHGTGSVIIKPFRWTIPDGEITKSGKRRSVNNGNQSGGEGRCRCSSRN
jgi:phosphoglucomutase